MGHHLIGRTAIAISAGVIWANCRLYSHADAAVSPNPFAQPSTPVPTPLADGERHERRSQFLAVKVAAAASNPVRTSAPTCTHTPGMIRTRSQHTEKGNAKKYKKKYAGEEKTTLKMAAWQKASHFSSETGVESVLVPPA